MEYQRPLIAYLSSGKTVQIHSPSAFQEPSSCLSPDPGAAVFHKPSGAMVVRCAEGTTLLVPQLKSEGKSLLSGKDWWNGAKGMGIVQDGKVSLHGRGMSAT